MPTIKIIRPFIKSNMFSANPVTFLSPKIF